MRRFMRDEVSWVQYRKITNVRQGQHAKITCMLNDEGILLAVREYVLQAAYTKFKSLLVF